MEAFHELTGVQPAVGGKHPKLGTHNALVSIGNGAYFELLCRDPEQPLDGPEAAADQKLWMGMESLQGMESTMLTWATDRGARSRRRSSARRGLRPWRRHRLCAQEARFEHATLEARIPTLHPEQMGPGRGIVPFLIDWNGNSTSGSGAQRM